MLTPWLSENVERLGWVLIHFLWEGALIGAASWMLQALLRKAAAQARYLALCAALAACGVARSHNLVSARARGCSRDLCRACGTSDATGSGGDGHDFVRRA